AHGRFLPKVDICFAPPNVCSASSAFLYVTHVQPVCNAASALALVHQHDPEHARKEHARHKRCRLAHGWFSSQSWQRAKPFLNVFL
ncbi:MAG: hypothetical protein WCC54_14160, partial [Pseudolabrys sp.]